jgi:hypothetical protein
MHFIKAHYISANDILLLAVDMWTIRYTLDELRHNAGETQRT